MAFFLQGFFQTPRSHGHLLQDQNMVRFPATQQDSASPLSHGSQSMGKRIRIRPLMDSSWQVGVANLTRFGALFFSPPSVSHSASSHGICRNLFYSCTCSICVQLHAGTSLQFEALSWWPLGCLSLMWLISESCSQPHSWLLSLPLHRFLARWVENTVNAVLGILAVRGMQYLPKNTLVHKSR